MLEGDHHVQIISSDLLPANELIMQDHQFTSYAFPLENKTYYVVDHEDGELFNTITDTSSYLKQELINKTVDAIKAKVAEGSSQMDDVVKEIVKRYDEQSPKVPIETFITQFVKDSISSAQFGDPLDNYIEKAARDLAYFYPDTRADMFVFQDNTALLGILPPVDLNFQKTLEQRKKEDVFLYPKTVSDFKYSQAIVDPTQSSEVDKEVRSYNRLQELALLQRSTLRNTYVNNNELYDRILEELRKSLINDNGGFNDLGQDFLNLWFERLEKKSD